MELINQFDYFKTPMYGSNEHKYNLYLARHINKQNKGSRGRDSERQKTYDAEHAFQKLVKDKEFKTIEQINRYAKKIYKSDTWIKLWEASLENDVTALVKAQPKVAKLSLKNKRFTGKTDGFTVSLNPVGGFNLYTLLHELSHCLGHMHHGRSFRKTLLVLVENFMGTKERSILESEFKKRKLPFGNPRKPLSFDDWMKSRERLEKAREEKDFREACLKMHEKLEKRKRENDRRRASA